MARALITRFGVTDSERSTGIICFNPLRGGWMLDDINSGVHSMRFYILLRCICKKKKNAFFFHFARVFARFVLFFCNSIVITLMENTLVT